MDFYDLPVRGNRLRSAVALFICPAMGISLFGIDASVATSGERTPTTRDSSTYDIEACKPRVQANGGFVELGFSNRANRVPSGGVVDLAVVFVDFPDAPATVDARTYFNSFIPQAMAMIKGFSYGRVDLRVNMPRQWLTMPKNSTEYVYSRGMSTEEHRNFMADAVSAADSEVDFSTASAVIVVMPPDLPGENYEVSPAFVSSPSLALSADGNTIMNGTTIGTDAPDMRDAVLVHEILHTMGLVDLYYPIDSLDDFDQQFKFTGPFSSMANIGGSSPELFAWERWVLDWVDDAQVACLGAGVHEVDLTSVAVPTESPRIAALPLGGTRFLVLEARTRDGRDLAGVEGVLPYVVDPSIPTHAGPIKVPAVSDTRVIDPIGVGETYVAEGIGIEVQARTRTTFTVTIHSPAPTPTVPDPVRPQGAVPTIVGGSIVSWREPSRSGWTPITGYRVRIGKGAWRSTTSTYVYVPKSLFRKKSLKVTVRAVNAVGVSSPVRITARRSSRS